LTLARLTCQPIGRAKSEASSLGEALCTGVLSPTFGADAYLSKLAHGAISAASMLDPALPSQWLM
jgi:hypothetical protein